MLRSNQFMGLALSLLFSGPVLADEIDLSAFGTDDDEEEEESEQGAASPDEDILELEDPDDDEWAVPQVPEGEEGSEDELKLDDEDYEDDSELTIGGPGQDTARLYREHLEEVRKLSPDEEALAWERYLKKYYNTIFRERIETRLDELSAEMYEEQVEDAYVRSTDAGTAEIRFAQPMTLENIDPRDKLRFGFEWGYPDYFGVTADLEMQITREFSVHGGIRGRYTGPNVEVGAKYALIKSARTKSLVTILTDVHLNRDPVHLGFRPQLAAGRRFYVGDFHLDAAMLMGTDLLFMRDNADNAVISPRFIGGTHVTFAASDVVRIYMETSTYMKDTFDDTIDQGFRFNTVAFGLKFINRASVSQDRFEAGIGAAVPYTYQWWGFYSGAINGDVIYYMDRD